MFEELMGLPAHPLLVHAAVVFVPLLIAASVIYAIVPYLRKWVNWVAVGLAVAAPFAAWFATLSGNAFRNRMVARNMAPPEILTQIDEHRDFGDRTLWATLILAVLTVVLVGLVERQRRASAGPTGRGGLVVSILLTIGILASAAISAYYVYQTGDSGARLVWDAF